jgi:uncharacterized protein YggE
MKGLSRFRQSLSVGCMVCLMPLAIGAIELAAARPAMAQEQQLRILTVTGNGSVAIPTTLSQVSLGVEVQANTAEQAQQQAARQSSAVVDLLRSRNVENLQTTGISLYPMYDYSTGNQELTGYVASNTVSFQIETSETGTLLDDVVSAGATRIDGVSFIADEDAIAAAQRDALREATADAQLQADAVLDTLGLTRQEIVGIQVNQVYQPWPQPVYYGTAARGDASTPVIGGDQEVMASVVLQIRY